MIVFIIRYNSALYKHIFLITVIRTTSGLSGGWRKNSILPFLIRKKDVLLPVLSYNYSTMRKQLLVMALVGIALAMPVAAQEYRYSQDMLSDGTFVKAENVNWLTG